MDQINKNYRFSNIPNGNSFLETAMDVAGGIILIIYAYILSIALMCL